MKRVIVLVALAAAFSQIGCATRPTPTAPEAQTKLAATKSQTDLSININTASAQDLEGLPGIGKVIAARIITHREQYGPFRRAEHLMMVPGISDRKFRAMRAMIVVQ